VRSVVSVGNFGSIRFVSGPMVPRIQVHARCWLTWVDRNVSQVGPFSHLMTLNCFKVSYRIEFYRSSVQSSQICCRAALCCRVSEGFILLLGHVSGSSLLSRVRVLGLALHHMYLGMHKAQAGQQLMTREGALRCLCTYGIGQEIGSVSRTETGP
jgi:hypothetical protein